MATSQTLLMSVCLVPTFTVNREILEGYDTINYLKKVEPKL